MPPSRSGSIARRPTPPTRTTPIPPSNRPITAARPICFPKYTGKAHRRRRRRVRHQGPGDGLFRRQHRHRDVALRAAFRDERQRLSPTPTARRRRACSMWSPARPTACRSSPPARSRPRSPPSPTTSTTAQGGLTMINDVDPGYDVCSVPKDQAMMAGKNIGDLLNAARRHLGRLHGRLQPRHHERQRHHRLQAQHAFDRGRHRRRRLHPAPQLVPVLRLDRQPEARAAELARGDRLQSRARRQDARSRPTTNTTCRISTTR